MLKSGKVILFFCFITFLAFLILNLAAPHQIEGDGVFYYSWLHSAVFDRDFDFKDQLEHFAAYDTASALVLKYRLTPTGKTPNAYAFGTALMWLPFFLVAHFLSLIFQIFNPDFFRPDGYSYFYILMINFSGWFFGAGAVFLIYKILKLILSSEKFSNHSVIPAQAGIQNESESLFQNNLDPRFRGDDKRGKSSDQTAILAVLAIWLATPLVYYQMLEPWMSHLASLFLVSVWLYLLMKIWQGEKVNSWVLAAIIFLLLATRWQNAIFLIGYLPVVFLPLYKGEVRRGYEGKIGKQNLPLSGAAFVASNGRDKRHSVSPFGLTSFLPVASRPPSFVRRGKLSEILFFLIPIAVFVIIQSLLWKNLFGEYFLTPQGVGFIRPQIHLLYTLFSTNRGLLLWSPILILALAGFYPLFKKTKFWAILSAVIFTLVWILNSSLNDLGGGDAFGGRRFIEVLPFLALGLGALFDEFKKYRWVITIIIAIFILWNLVLMENYRQGIIPHSGEFDFLISITGGR